MANKSICPISTPKFKEYAKQFPEYLEAEVINNIGMWQSRYNKTIEDLPSVTEFRDFKAILEKEELISQKSFSIDNITSLSEKDSINLDYDPMIRRARVTMLTRMFSTVVDNLIQEDRAEYNNIIENTTGEAQNNARVALARLDRFEIIKKYKPIGIFDKIRKDVFENYVNSTDEERIQAELNTINEKYDSKDYSSKERLEDATFIANRNKNAYQKVLKNYSALIEEASFGLTTTEGIVIDLNGNGDKVANLSEGDSDGESELNRQANDDSKEYTYKDGWMTNFRHVSSHESLSQEIRKIINNIPKLEYDGTYALDDIGFNQYLDSNYVHATLIDALKDMVSVDDMLPILKKLAKDKIWVEEIIDLLEENKNEAIYSQFYQNFRKDFMPYWVHKKSMRSDGSFIWETFPINKPEGTYYLLDAWRDNYQNGVILTRGSVYNKDGTINIENAILELEHLNTLQNTFNNKTTQERLELLETDTKEWKGIINSLKKLGIDPNPAILRTALTNIVETPGITITDPIMLLLPALNTIYSGIKKGDLNVENKNTESEKRADLINTFGGAFNEIASMISEVTEDAIESSVHELGKSYYGHLTPNYLGKMIKNLKNVANNEARFKEYLNTEFKQYDWFYDKTTNQWRHDWLKQLEENPSMRKALAHKVILHADKITYSDWDSLDYTLVLLNEYFGDPDSGTSDVQFANYHLPILSDSPSAEFIRFRKYTSTKGLGAQTFKEQLVDKFIDVIQQEYSRIMVVRERDIQYQKNPSSIGLIANYDISRDSTGKIKNIGGAEFKFLPMLNDLTFENGDSFLDRLIKLSNGDSKEDLRGFLQNSIYTIMDKEFNHTYSEWVNMGLLEEVSTGALKHLAWGKGQSNKDLLFTKALEEAKVMLGDKWIPEMEYLLENFKSIDYNDIINISDNIRQTLVDMQITGDIYKTLNNLKYTNNNREKLEEYFWNSKFATTQIIQLTTTDLAFYKDLEDFQKRFKEVHAPALKLNTQALFNGEKVGREWERTIYLKDSEIVSTAINDITEVMLDKYNRGELNAYTTANILAKFGYVNHEIKDVKTGAKSKYVKIGDTIVKTSYINVADAQAYRSLSSYKAILAMSGEWNDSFERAYQNIKSGNFNIVDFDIIWQPKKPYVYTQVNNNSGLPSKSGIKTPVQHKNSEFPLFAMHAILAGELGKSNKLVAINEFMESNNIDVVQFESTTKVGKQGVIDLEFKQPKLDKTIINSKGEEIKYGTVTILGNEVDVYALDGANYKVNDTKTLYTIQNTLEKLLKAKRITQEEYDKELNNWKILSKKDVLNTLSSATTINGVENPNVIHKVSYEDYGIQTATPEHVIDSVQLVGTQLRKLITADINDNNLEDLNFKIKVGNRELTLREWLQLYNEINTENILQSFRAVNSIFEDKKQVEKLLLEEIKGNPRYGTEIAQAVTLDENGNFTIPLYDPIMSQKIQTLINSVLKNRITKQKISGGSLIQVSNYGLSEELNIVFEGEGENRRIKYFECYMPAYSEAFYKPLMKEGTHELDINKLPEELKRAIGYRIPTEDKYSMIPLRIKGFLPQQNGSSIMLPADITTIAGSDFDIDKLYIMLPEFTIEDNIIKKVNYNYELSAEKNGVAARNNLLIDMMWGVLTNPDTTAKILNPGGFDDQKKTARIISVLQSSDTKSLIGLLEVNSITEGISKLQNMELGELNKIASKIKTKLDPISPLTQVVLHQQNMTGNKLIGIYANHNANHALIQHTELELKQGVGDFWLADEKYTSLHAVKNAKGEYISRNNAGFLSASVDNAKDPVLSFLNQNTLTADTSMLLSRLGYNSLTIGLLLNQPIIKDITQSYFRNYRTGKSKQSIIENIIKEYKIKADNMSVNNYDSFKTRKFPLTELFRNIIISKDMGNITKGSQTTDWDKIEYYSNQVAIGYLFMRIMKSSEALGTVVQITRADTANGGPNNTIADTIIKLNKITDFEAERTEDSYPLVNTSILNNISFNDIKKQVDSKYNLQDLTKALDELFNEIYKGGNISDVINRYKDSPIIKDFLQNVSTKDYINISSKDIIKSFIEDKHYDKLREELLKSPLPWYQSFHTLGLVQSKEVFSNYFPHFNNSFIKVISDIRKLTKSEQLDSKTINNIYNDLFAYIMTNTKYFGEETSKGVTAADKRRSFINDFVPYFKEIVSNNEDIANLEFIKRLQHVFANDKNPVDVIIFKNVGKLNPTLRERYTRDWEYLLYMKDNPKAQEFAVNLFKYCFYRNGFAFGPNTFSHLAPLILRTMNTEYVNTLSDLMSHSDSYSKFVNQYVYNHLSNRKIVPEIIEDSTIEFMEDKEIKNIVDVEITKGSNSSDKNVIRKSSIIDGKENYEFHKFIAKRTKKDFVYYTLIESTSTTARYMKITPLGYKNSFIEYEYGVYAESMVNTIDTTKKRYTSNYSQDADFMAYESINEVNEEFNDISQIAFDSLIESINETDEYFIDLNKANLNNYESVDSPNPDGSNNCK